MGETTFIVRIDAKILRKLDYIAKYDDQSRNAEVNRMIRKHIAAFERENGPITEEDLQAPES